MKILIIGPTRIGDAVLASGLVRHLSITHEKAEVTIACGVIAAPLYQGLPNLERIITIVKKPASTHWITVWREVVGTKWDIVVDIRRSIIPWTVWTKKRFISRSALDENEHRVVSLARTLHLQDRPPAPYLWISDKHHKRAKQLIPDGGQVLAIAPTANWPGKIWRSERFAELIKQLTNNKSDGILPKARVVIFGGPGEASIAAAVIESIPAEQRIDLVGKEDLPTVAACLKRCSLFIGNDSGLMHMAAAAQIPTVGLFGPSRAENYHPWGSLTIAVRTEKSYEDLVGGISYDRRNADTMMDTLLVESVAEASIALWKKYIHNVSLTSISSETPMLSALLVVHNEESHLSACLDTVKFSDDIVVVLDRCTDRSKDIALSYGARIIEGEWELEGDRRNIGIDACIGDWILEVDADERVTKKLADEIRSKISRETSGYFLIPFHNYVGDHLIKYGWGASWGVSATVRLFSNGPNGPSKRWGDQRVHPRIDLKGSEGKLTEPMVHYVDKNISDMLRRLDRYTTARAADLRDNGDIGNLGANIRRIFSRFWKCYISRRGYREGAYGFLIALMASLYPILSYLKARYED